jgi:indole-3-glycerol phosphate synthase
MIKSGVHSVMNTGSDVLDKIMRHKREEVDFEQRQTPLADLKAMAGDTSDCRGFSAAIKNIVSTSRSAVIAEVKKASPSKGLIRADFAPDRIAESYQEHGATCLSVLTDTEFFQGSKEHFALARQVVELPILRKDFMLDEYQIFEAKTMQADCILLIAAALEDGLMQDLAGRADELGLDVLIEVHNHQELERALAYKMPIVGINNRNLKTFETSLATTTDLLAFIPKEVVVVTESGIHTHSDIELMKEHNVNSFLVGEAFMRAEDPGKQLASLFF